MGRAFWIKAAIYYGAGVNMLNIFNNLSDEAERTGKPYSEILAEIQKDPKKFMDYTMWGNDPGHRSHLFGGRYPDGRKRYVRWGKQFRELFEFIYSTGDYWYAPSFLEAGREKLGGKANPLLQMINIWLNGKSLSGFEERDLDKLKGWSRTGKVASIMMNNALPFSTKDLFSEEKRKNL